MVHFTDGIAIARKQGWRAAHGLRRPAEVQRVGLVARRADVPAQTSVHAHDQVCDPLELSLRRAAGRSRFQAHGRHGATRRQAHMDDFRRELQVNTARDNRAARMGCAVGKDVDLLPFQMLQAGDMVRRRAAVRQAAVDRTV
ncbi:hypothetical protein G6F68_017556 [Rhizopus microsporus]|nr:hypothetical protein G6F68_017556 [Rhizopus microsporus]